MKHLKVLPLAAFVAASISALPSFAESDVEALEKRIQELESKIETGYIYDQQPAVLTPEIKVPAGVVFSGYARYGAHYQGNKDAATVGTHGALNANATGRLGNEGNGGEFQLAKAFQSDSGAIWDLVLMLDHWSDSSWASDGGVNVKKMYAGATNLFESQPDLYIWAGRDFHQRPQTGLNDYFWMTHDGQGAGFYNLDLGGVKFDLGVVAEIDGDMVGETGRYSVTSKFHGIQLGDSASLSLFANYGFASEKTPDDSLTTYQLAGELSFAGQRLLARYSDNTTDSTLYSHMLQEGKEAMLVSFDGSQSLSDKAGIEYLAAYQSLKESGNESRVNYNVIVRPTYQWDEIHSTWLEAGYSVVDYDDIDATNSSWKFTVSQNMAVGPETWSRPMLRFYATAGNADNEYAGTNTVGDIVQTDLDTFTVGAMFEAWW